MPAEITLKHSSQEIQTGGSFNHHVFYFRRQSVLVQTSSLVTLRMFNSFSFLTPKIFLGSKVVRFWGVFQSAIREEKFHWQWSERISRLTMRISNTAVSNGRICTTRMRVLDCKQRERKRMNSRGECEVQRV